MWSAKVNAQSLNYPATQGMRFKAKKPNAYDFRERQTKIRRGVGRVECGWMEVKNETHQRWNSRSVLREWADISQKIWRVPKIKYCRNCSKGLASTVGIVPRDGLEVRSTQFPGEGRESYSSEQQPVLMFTSELGSPKAYRDEVASWYQY